MRVLVTCDAGYIDSHTCDELLESGHEICVIDNLCKSHEVALDLVRGITNYKLQFMNAGIRGANTLDKIFNISNLLNILVVKGTTILEQLKVLKKCLVLKLD